MLATRVLVGVITMGLASAAGVAYVDLHAHPATPTLTEVPVDRGDIVESVIATGTLQPTRSVTIGAQVSGTIDKVFVDFNSIVHKGQVLALIDPSIVQASVDAARASVENAQIAVTAHTATRDNDRREADRIAALYAQGLETAADLDAARLLTEQDDVQVREDQDDVRVAQSDLQAAQMDLTYCTITSPIDGVVIARDVDAGQTVQSRMTAPDLFVLGTDLTSLTLVGDVDESDISRVHSGEPVAFTVESYPDTFHGRVVAVRLDATNTSNVVTYQTIVSVANPDLRLLPGMTASFRIETNRVANAVRVSNTALRFRPTPDLLAYYGQAPAPAASDAHAGHVWVVEGGSIHAVPVSLGMTDGRDTQVLGDAVRPGEPVLTNGLMPVTHR